jgi:hypothetical protein
MPLRIVLVTLLLILCIFGIIKVFWEQELQYAQPTPRPYGFAQTAFSQQLALPDSSGNGQALFLHFFNPDCPCSRFNIKHVQQLIASYGKQITFKAIIPPYADEGRAREMLGDKIPVIVDEDNRWAEACGVYSTPQAVIIDEGSVLYFRGNYNRSRYCTDPKTNYAELALIDFIKGRELPALDIYAIQSYGCTFFKDDTTTFFTSR